jgi:hypothetical protein
MPDLTDRTTQKTSNKLLVPDLIDRTTQKSNKSLVPDLIDRTTQKTLTKRTLQIPLCHSHHDPLPFKTIHNYSKKTTSFLVT